MKLLSKVSLGLKNLLKQTMETLWLVKITIVGPEPKYDLRHLKSIANTIQRLIRCEIIKINIIFTLLIISFIVTGLYLYLEDALKEPWWLNYYSYALAPIYLIGFIYLLLQNDYYLSRKRSIVGAFRRLYMEEGYGFQSTSISEEELKQLLVALLTKYLEPDENDFYQTLFEKLKKGK